MSRTSRQFSAVRTEGGLLPQDLLSRIQCGDPDLTGTQAETYHLGPHERIGEAANRSWSRLLATWRAFQQALEKESETSHATGLTRERWLLPLFQELGYGRLPKCTAIEIDDKTYAVSHTWHHSPIHLLGCRIDLEVRQKGVAGAAKSSPHGLVQEFLNRSPHHRWGFVTNGYRLRILRDHHSLTRQAYVEFDLRMIMDGEQYSEFLLLWLVCHQSRVEADKPEECWLETWVNTSRDEGVRALDKLRDGVEKAIESFGTGFLAHGANTQLLDALESGELDKQEYYRQVLHLVYRLIFLFVAEERDALLDPSATDEARERYRRYYATRRLRDLADKRRGSPHGDLWRGLALIMKKLDGGYPALGLPALGSRLWEPTACPWLVEAECTNEHVLSAIRHLSHIREGNTRYPVNWRNVGADELGSVYESLLERRPRIHKQAATFELETAAGHERKTSGSYYTPTSLVDCLLDSALDPVLDEACKKPDPEAAVLDLTVCDPACGSGHFLVAAARRIAKHLASVRSGDDEPSPRDVQKALRDVVGRCIYGVDLNPMAVELCKVSLWMEAIEPGKPLSFLDGHIQCGNALLGATPALMANGIPDEAFLAVEGDDRKTATRLKRRNRDERGGQSTFFSSFADVAGQDINQVSSQAGEVERTADDNIGDVRQKAAGWERLTHSPMYEDARFRADAWCSAFFWPKQPGELENAAVTHDLWRRIQSDVTAAPQLTRKTVRDLSTQHLFFHWHLAFPTVFVGAEEGVSGDTTGWIGGFDVILGNPPWDTLSPDVKEFFSAYDPAIRTEPRSGQRRITDRLLESPDIAAAWEQNRRSLYGQVHFFKNSGRYVMYAPGNLGKGDFNIFRMFVEAALTTTRRGGAAAQIVPDGLYGGANCMAIRKALFEQHGLERLFAFENSAGVWFPSVHRSQKFCLYSARNTGVSISAFGAAFGIRTVPQLAEVLGGDILQMPVRLVREFSPDALAIMEFQGQGDVDIAAKMYDRHPKFGDESIGSPYRHYMRELDMGNDRALFTEDADAIPLYEGRMVAQYDHRAKGYRSGRGRKAVWEDLSFEDPGKSIQPQWCVPSDRLPTKVRERYQAFRVGFCDVASPTNERTLVATLLPPNTICGDKVPTILFANAMHAHVAWLAVANSFVMDFLVRMKVSLKMSYTVVDSLPFPRFEQDSEVLRYLVPRVLRLVCTGPEMVPFWNMMAAEGWVQDHASDLTVPGITDEAKRRQVRAEIDAYVGRDLYSLTRDELAHVLDTFPIVEKRDLKAFGEYRTKQLVLAAFDRLSGRQELNEEQSHEEVPRQPTAYELPGSRLRLAKELVGRLESRGASVLLGPRGGGKTEMLRRVERLLSGDHIYYVDLQRCDVSTPDTLAASIVPSLRGTSHPADALRDLVTCARAPAVFLLDEIAYLARVVLSAVPTTFGWLRGLGQHDAALLFAGTRVDWAVVLDHARKEPGSSFGNDVETIDLLPLDPDEARHCLSTGHDSLPPSVVATVIDRVGTWPCYLGIMARALFERSLAGLELKEDVVDVVIKEELLDRRKHLFLDRWNEVPAEGRRALLSDPPGRRPRVKDLSTSARHALRDAQLLDENGQWLDGDLPFWAWLKANRADLSETD